LPFEASGSLPNNPNNPNNPMAMAHNILNSHFQYSVFNTDSESLNKGEPDMMNLPLFSYGKKTAAFLFGRKQAVIHGFSDEQYKIINDQLNFMYNSKACAEAFEKAGLPSPKSMMDYGKMVFVHASKIDDPANNPSWFGPEELRDRIYRLFDSNSGARAATETGG
jgi:hypothetical protein